MIRVKKTRNVHETTKVPGNLKKPGGFHENGGMWMNICVYGASSRTLDPSYLEEMTEFGRKMAERGHTLIFGAGATGMMGAVAEGVSSKNGRLIGVCPYFLDKGDVLFTHCTELIYTETMRERKQKLEELSDAFVVAPGGVGTLDEFFEILTLKHLGRHTKPIVIFNLQGFYNELISFVEKSIQENFMLDSVKDLFFVSENTEEILEYLERK